MSFNLTKYQTKLIWKQTNANMRHYTILNGHRIKKELVDSFIQLFYMENDQDGEHIFQRNDMVDNNVYFHDFINNNLILYRISNNLRNLPRYFTCESTIDIDLKNHIVLVIPPQDHYKTYNNHIKILNHPTCFMCWNECSNITQEKVFCDICYFKSSHKQRFHKHFIFTDFCNDCMDIANKTEIKVNI